MEEKGGAGYEIERKSILKKTDTNFGPAAACIIPYALLAERALQMKRSPR